MIAHVDGQAIQADAGLQKLLPSAPIAAPIFEHGGRIGSHDGVAQREPGNRWSGKPQMAPWNREATGREGERQKRALRASAARESQSGSPAVGEHRGERRMTADGCGHRWRRCRSSVGSYRERIAGEQVGKRRPWPGKSQLSAEVPTAGVEPGGSSR